MQEQKNSIRDNQFFKYASAKKYLKIFVPNFAFKHDDTILSNTYKDKFVGREPQFRKLFAWLTSDSKSGSYLVTGYRGVGKSLLVKRVIERITRDPKAYKEIAFQFMMVFVFLACFIATLYPQRWLASILLLAIAVIVVLCMQRSLKINNLLYENKVKFLKNHYFFDKDLVSKWFVKQSDKRERKHNRMAVTINLGQEILDERDVLCLITQMVRDKYYIFVHNRQTRPFLNLIFYFLSSLLVCVFYNFIVKALISVCLSTTKVGIIYTEFSQEKIWCDPLLNLALCLLCFWLVMKLLKYVRKNIPMLSVPYKAIDRLDVLCERINSTIREERISQYSTNGVLPLESRSHNRPMAGVSFRRDRITPIAGVREIEQELMEVINIINSKDCPKTYRAQFIIVFDELDKVTKDSSKTNSEKDLPDFESSVSGFTDAMAYEERKRNVLRLLANMKLFIASVKAKCVFISGHELFDAAMADLSDREFAVSSIFNGVLNVSSFLSPEQEEYDVSSMTELYIVNMLLPSEYLQEKMQQNAADNYVLKDEYPSLRWYNEYLIETHVLNQNELSTENLNEKVSEIRYAVEFLRHFSVFLAHISNGSPKKIATYFEKYIKLNYDTIHQFDWDDVVTVGLPAETETDVRKQCVLYFDATDQKLINFIHFIASPVMNVITNEVSHYGDKLLVASSFILDNIYKYHGSGFSWRNLEQMPELLNSNKIPELRDSMTSIVEFLLQTHISPISSGIFQYKFDRQISEEISTLSKISDEASAIFNFTLNETETVKRYNNRLLHHYAKLAEITTKSIEEDGGEAVQNGNYTEILQRIHENLGDIFLSEEDYYRAIHEYKSAMQYIFLKKNKPSILLTYVKCALKICLAYEYRNTYENAYLMYGQIIDQLINHRWIDKDTLPVGFVWKLTNDWRIKQPTMVYPLPSSGYPMVPELWDVNRRPYTYSLDTDMTTSGLSTNYSPEKSKVLMQNMSFEEVRFIYQTLIAKLFVLEKMESSGITQTNIDEIESVFMTLSCLANNEEKFIIAADFFNKMGEVLYYKNNFVITSPAGNLTSVLYTFDINLWALIDDYCKFINGNSIKIKNDIFNCLRAQQFDEYKSLAINNFHDLVKKIINKNPTNYYACHYLQKVDNLKIFSESNPNAFNPVLDELLWKKMKDCHERRSQMSIYGCHLPCNACKYVNRSLFILMSNMYKDPIEKYDKSKAIILIENASKKKLRHLKPTQVSLLAYTAEQMGNLQLSCACTHRKDNHPHDQIKQITIDCLCSSGEGIQALIGNELSRLDKAILYYWAASRYYIIASMNKEAAHCVERIMKVIEDYLFVNLEFGTPTNLTNVEKTVEVLFKEVAKLVGSQYDNFDLSEIQSYKWLFHLDHTDNMDLMKLSIFPTLRPIFITSLKCKALLLRGDEKINYINEIYSRIAPALRHDKTFRGEVEANYLKAYVNKLLLMDFLDMTTFIDASECCSFQVEFYKKICIALTEEREIPLSKNISTSSVQEKLDFFDFLIVDSTTCLTNILKILSPHNHITTFSNSFVGNVYYLLWEWNLFYQSIHDLYSYYRYSIEDNKCKEKFLTALNCKNSDIGETLQSCVGKMKESGIPSKNNMGYLYSRLLMSIRHEMDDTTIFQQNITLYAAMMAKKYYQMAQEVNQEGAAYKSMITAMHVLDDDLHNDTNQSNLSDERYKINCGLIAKRIEKLDAAYERNSVRDIKNYERNNWQNNNEESGISPYDQLKSRFKDSIYINSEY